MCSKEMETLKIELAFEETFENFFGMWAEASLVLCMDEAAVELELLLSVSSDRSSEVDSES